MPPPPESETLCFPFDHPHDRPADELSDRLGGKGAGLAMMAGELALPVPPGFTLTIEACRRYRTAGWDDALEAALQRGLEDLGAKLDARLGDADRPLIVSVRSGADVSMPGMMDTVLCVGLDATTITALARQDEAFAEDCRTRFEASWAETIGGRPPADASRQLREAISAVFRSADSDRARSYRLREGLPADPNTAVTVQAMVFGNRDDRSGTGVVFSRDPASGAPSLYGDVLFRAQGEDVVSGRHATRPVSELEDRMPEVASLLGKTVSRLERRLRDLCEVEFTIESGRLFILQVRKGKRTARAALRIAIDLALDPDFPLDRREAVLRVRDHLASPPVEEQLLFPDGVAAGVAAPAPAGLGIGASPGIRSGVIQTEVAGAVAAAAAGHDVILCRPETSPSDIDGIECARALLTASGGLASHAAVVARGWGIPAVVGLAGLAIDARGITLGGLHLAVGDPVTLDGTTGEVFAGALETRSQVAPEAARLIRWAEELGLEIPPPEAPRAPRPTPHAPPANEAAVSNDSILRTLSIRGSATQAAIAAVVGASEEKVASPLAALEADGLIEPARPIGLTLTPLGRERAEALAEHDARALGRDVARAALDAFQPLDARLKQTVTDWQLRAVAGELVPNDHSDNDWDRSVFDRLATTLDDAEEWLTPLTNALPRLARYLRRLRDALEAATGGDGRFVASPVVDSLHGVWFELHEDLIRLAGSSRSEELAAGRSA